MNKQDINPLEDTQSEAALAFAEERRNDIRTFVGASADYYIQIMGLRGVPESVREAAISFGANKWCRLTKVDLPLASPSIRSGIIRRSCYRWPWWWSHP
jgi:ABC-type nitrate/sulfonate/bicarbonate transport system permease component